jgi:flagellin-like protein
MGGSNMTIKFYKNDKGVSAVIGVVLMVAITVILAALIAAYVFYYGGNVENSKIVAVDVKRATDTGIITVVTLSETDVGSLKSGGTGNTILAEATYTLVANGRTIPPCNSNGIPLLENGLNKFNANTIGSIMYFGSSSDPTLIPAGADITVVAHYIDNTGSVVWSGVIA